MDDIEFIKICNESNTMSEAASRIGLHFNSFKRKALKLGCYTPNQGSKNTEKPWMRERSISLNEILEGKYPQYQTFKLKNRLFEAGLKINKCEECGICEWNSKPLMCELDHINGNSHDHRLSNLKILCPNCHSQTDTFRAKNIGRVT